MSRFRRKQSTEVIDPEPTAQDVGTGKGRPTPKRRTSSSPVKAPPKTRKEAIAWQKEHGARASVAGQKKLTPAEYRAAIKAGDQRVLPRRDQGVVRALARDYVDSRRMASNYLLWLFPMLVIGYFVPFLQILTLVLFFALVLEWMYTGNKIKRLAAERGHDTRETALGLGFYAGSRAYFKRDWRRPLPAVQIGDEI
jgi:hypothetical protein